VYFFVQLFSVQIAPCYGP